MHEEFRFDARTTTAAHVDFHNFELILQNQHGGITQCAELCITLRCVLVVHCLFDLV